MNVIPSFSLTQQYEKLGDALQTAVQEVLASGRYIGGTSVEQFEQAFARYVGTQACVSCNSGTDALWLALRALDIGPGDEVITTPFTFFASAEVISAVGATPVFADIHPHTFNLDPAAIEAALTPRTRALLPVHLFGQPAEMAALLAIAQRYHLAVIEDCAQATGATWEGQPVGSLGTLGCFSFYPTKNLGACGDGGAVTTQDPLLAAKIRSLKNHGQADQRYIHHDVGINSRLDALQSAILLVKLPYLNTWNDQRRAIAQTYDHLLQSLPEVTCPRVSPPGQSVWNQYTIRVAPGDRPRLQTHLQHQGIGTSIYYPHPLHLQEVYQSLGYQAGQLPQAEAACREVLSLPMFPELTPDQQERVAIALQTGLASCP